MSNDRTDPRDDCNHPVTDDSWPAHGLTPVNICPLCGGAGRRLMHEGLVDWVFAAAPGRWTMCRCTDCDSGYLDPRPSDETLHLAYRGYFTHSTTAPPHETGAGRLSVKDRVIASYTNRVYGGGVKDGLPLGWVFAPLWNKSLRRADRRHCYLKRPHGSVLDVGFGGAEFLDTMRSCGWSAVGVDFDPVCVANARKRGFDVYEGGIDHEALKSMRFDAVTLQHSIEHVPNPYSVLERAFELLVPGGEIFIETPNLDAYGHADFGVWWRGLEPPRHLCVVTHMGLSGALQKIGFTSIRRRWMPSRWVWTVSREAAKKYAAGGVTAGSQGRNLTLQQRLDLRFFSRHHEFVALTARKPE